MSDLRQSVSDKEDLAIFNALRMAEGGIVLAWGFITTVHEATVDVYLANGSLLNDRTTVEGIIYARHVKNVVCSDVASMRPGQFTCVFVGTLSHWVRPFRRGSRRQ